MDPLARFQFEGYGMDGSWIDLPLPGEKCDEERSMYNGIDNVCDGGCDGDEIGSGWDGWSDGLMIQIQ